MNMKNFIVRCLIRIAKRISRKETENVFEEKQIYEPKVCGSAYIIDKNYVRKLKKAEHIKSTREAIELAKRRELDNATHDVLATIEQNIMQKATYKKGDSYIVEVRVNCYAPKKT